MTILLDNSTSLKSMENLTKYKELEIEVEWMWGLKTMFNSPGGCGSPWYHQEGHGKIPGIVAAFTRYSFITQTLFYNWWTDVKYSEI